MNHTPPITNQVDTTRPGTQRTCFTRTATCLFAAVTWALGASLPALAQAQDIYGPYPGTSMILSGTCRLDNLDPDLGNIGADLAGISGHENTWSAALTDVSYVYVDVYDYIDDPWYGYILALIYTEYTYTVGKFSITFSGPDADLLNDTVASQLTSTWFSVVVSGGGSEWFGDAEWLFELTPADPAAGISLQVLKFGTWVDEFDPRWPVDPQATSDVGTSLEDHRPGNAGRLYSFDTVSAIYPQPTIAIADVSKAEGNKGSTAFVFDVTLSNASPYAISIDYATRDGTASAPSDYKAASGTLTFKPGETSKTITVLVSGDRKKEPNETFLVNLGSPPWGVVVDGLAIGTILNDDR